MLVEEGGARLLIDPGVFSKDTDAGTLDAILITHTHQDHMDTDLIKQLLEKSPNAQVIAVAEAVKSLSDAGIESTSIEDGAEVTVAGVSVKSFGKHHSFIYGDIPQCQNTGFMIGNRFYHPGDSFHVPAEQAEILALPVAGPWMKIAEAIDYAKTVAPKVVIPMHDGFYGSDERQMMRSFPKMILEKEHMDFCDLQDGASKEF